MSSPLKDLKTRIDALPREPGVDVFKGGRGEILYIGKARDLRARVQTYLNEGGDGRPLVPYLQAEARDVDAIVTSDEFQALLLENSMIRKEKPKYNIRLRDDKSFVSLRYDPRKTFSRLEVVRRSKRDGARYLGPFLSASSVRATLRLVLELHPLRLCTDAVFRNRTRACVYHPIGLCPAPCVDKITAEEYEENLRAAVRLLKGQDTDLVEALEKKMWAASRAQNFEVAGRIRDQIQAVRRTAENAQVVRTGFMDRDVLALARKGDALVVEILTVREGRLVQARGHAFRSPLPDEEVILSFLVQYYDRERGFPLQVLVEQEPEGREDLEAWLGHKRGGGVQIRVPRRGEGVKLLHMAARNARQALEQHLSRSQEDAALLDDLHRRLGLSRKPVRMECYDISHTGGKETTGVVVTFENGVADKDGYRRFKVQGPGWGDDYEALEEVLRRRFTRLVAREETLPDLVVIDGGKGQLGRAVRVLKEVGVGMEEVDLIALAKGRTEDGRRIPAPARREKIFVAGVGDPRFLGREDPVLHLLDRLRDEAHRFAVTYHRKLRARARVGSILETVPGVGPRTRDRILTAFGSVEGLKNVGAKEIACKAGVPRKTADAVARWIRKQTHPRG